MKKRIVFIAALTAVGCVLHVAEAWFPTPGYGARLGLANVAGLLALSLLGPGAALMVTVLRVLLGCLLSGAVSALPYGMAGGILAIPVMWLALRWVKGISVIGASAAGAAAHSLAQTVVAALMAGGGAFLFLPVLWLLSVAAGAAMGGAAHIILRSCPKIT